MVARPELGNNEAPVAVIASVDSSDDSSDDNDASEDFRELFSLPVSECPLTGEQLYIPYNKQSLTLAYQSITVKFAYKEPSYKELPVIRNWFSFPSL